MDKVITTALLIVIGMVLAVSLFNSAYPAVMDSGQAISAMAGRTEDRLQSQIEIIHVAGVGVVIQPGRFGSAAQGKFIPGRLDPLFQRGWKSEAGGYRVFVQVAASGVHRHGS